ncbi:acyl carrier protein [Treponema socranskii]|uniref:acyl carrier protein n=1 Tax=Treponema socranskii TaxID=53419 RepID=UPI003D6FF7F0
MEQKVIELLKRVFEETEITADSSQETVTEWDSMHQLSIAFEIENEFRLTLQPEEIALMNSVKDIVALLEKKN